MQYTSIPFLEGQQYMDEEWFQEEAILDNREGVPPATYLIPNHRLNLETHDLAEEFINLYFLKTLDNPSPEFQQDIRSLVSKYKLPNLSVIETEWIDMVGRVLGEEPNKDTKEFIHNTVNSHT